MFPFFADFQKTYSRLDKTKIKPDSEYSMVVETIKIPYIEYTFKGVLIRILQENMQFIDNDDIYGVIASIESKYQNEFNKRTKKKYSKQNSSYPIFIRTYNR